MKRKLDIIHERNTKFDVGLSNVNNAGYNTSSTDFSINVWTNRPLSARYYEILEKRKKLPVYGFHDDLIDKVKNNQIIVVEGETGSGKTTQIPQVKEDSMFLLLLLSINIFFIAF